MVPISVTHERTARPSQHRAGAALGEPATKFGTVQREIVAQHVEQSVSASAGTDRCEPLTLRLIVILSPVLRDLALPYATAILPRPTPSVDHPASFPPIPHARPPATAVRFRFGYNLRAFVRGSHTSTDRHGRTCSGHPRGAPRRISVSQKAWITGTSPVMTTVSGTKFMIYSRIPGTGQPRPCAGHPREPAWTVRRLVDGRISSRATTIE